MKILLQNSIFYPNVIGGAELATHLLGAELRRRGWTVDAVATTGRRGGQRDLSERPTADGLGRVYEAASHGLCDIYDRDGVPPQSSLPVRGLHHFAGVASRRWHRLFLDVLEQAEPDVVHTNTIVGMTPSIWSAAARHGIPVVHTLHDYHLLCPRTTLLRSNNTDCLTPPLPCRLLAALKRPQTRHVDVVTAPSRFVLDRHLSTGCFARARSEVVPNACEYVPPDLPQRSIDGPLHGLFLGQLAEHKGVNLLLDVLDRLFSDPACAQLHFDFAGTGPVETAVADFCRAHAERCRWHGVVKGQDKFDLLRSAAFLVVPSIWNDNFPLSILDGFSWGLPVIGSDRGGIPEVIRHDRDGRIVVPETDALAAAVRAYLAEPALLLEHGRSAREHALGLTLERQVERFEAIYQAAIAARANRP